MEHFSQERFTEDAVKAVSQLVENCQNKNADQLAELEAQLFLLGLSRLADVVRLQGITNAGSEYPPLFFKTLQSKFEVA